MTLLARDRAGLPAPPGAGLLARSIDSSSW